MKQNLNKKELKILALSSLGGALEFYDFIIFVFFAKYISMQFFPSDIGEFWAMLHTYGVFATGYLVRPLGGIVMAHFGDKFGRKNMFMLSILLMVIPTFALAFIPSFEYISYWAILLLLLVRIAQGIAIGGELPGAWVFIREHSAFAHKGLYLSCLNAAMAFGVFLGALMSFLININFSEEAILDFAWRIPFFIGGIFGLLAVYLRKFLQETPVFEQMKAEQKLSRFPLKDFLQSPKILTAIIPSMLITWVLTACVVVLLLLMPQYLNQILAINTIQALYIQMAGILCLSFGTIVVGYSCDKFKLFKSMLFYTPLFGLCAFIFVGSFYHQELFLALLFYLILCFFAGINAFAPIIMTDIFKPQIRFSGISFSYNIAYAFAGSFTPQLIFYLHNLALKGIFIWGIALYLGFIALIALVAAFLVRTKV